MNKSGASEATTATKSTRVDKGLRIAQSTQREDVALQRRKPVYLGLSMNQIYDQLEADDFLKANSGQVSETAIVPS